MKKTPKAKIISFFFADYKKKKWLKLHKLVYQLHDLPSV